MADNIIENIGDIDTTLNPVTKDHGLEMLGNVSDQPVALRRFSRAIFKIGELIKGLATGKENKFSKNSGFNKNKSDGVNSTDSNTLATSKAVKSAYDRGSSGITKADQAYTLANGKEPKFNKNSGFNLDITHLVNSTSKILVASALAVKTAYDKGVTALNKANQAYNLANGKEPKITKKTGFNLNKSDSVTSTSTILLATAKAVKTAYDKGVSALNLANTNKSAILNNEEQTASRLNWTSVKGYSNGTPSSFTVASTYTEILVMLGSDGAGTSDGRGMKSFIFPRPFLESNNFFVVTESSIFDAGNTDFFKYSRAGNKFTLHNISGTADNNKVGIYYR